VLSAAALIVERGDRRRDPTTTLPLATTNTNPPIEATKGRKKQAEKKQAKER